jgi:hypothetical protein
VHGDLILRGWFTTAVWVVTVVLLGCSLWLVVDALRRPATAFGQLGRAPWVGLQAVFLTASVFGLAASLLGFARALPAGFAVAVGVLIVLAAAQQIGYLLRVVFPSPARRSRLGAAVPVAPSPSTATSSVTPDSLDPEE